MSRIVRILSTHDFFGSFAKLPTSYGMLAGGDGLRSAVHELRNNSAAIWADTGDFSQGGPLSLATRGTGGFVAASELGIDVSVVGNHDLDFGVKFLQNEASRLGFPLLCANVELGLPQTTSIETSAGVVGFIGLTHHDLYSMRSWSIEPGRGMPSAQQQLSIDVVAIASDLRKSGADAVVAIVHDGVDWNFTPNGSYLIQEESFLARCRPWLSAVDLIVAGHSLGRFMGNIDGTPIMQPWPMGAEVGVIDLDLSLRRVEGRPRGILVQPKSQWSGFGADVIASAQEDVLGHLDYPLVARSGGPAPLADFLARAVFEVADSDMAFAYTTCGQPPIDGAFAFLDRGPVTWLQLLQIVPYTDYRILVAEIDVWEIETVRALIRPRPQARTTAWAEHAKPQPAGGTVKIATTAGASPEIISGLVGRSLNWDDSGGTLPEGMKKVLDCPTRNM